ncbi:MAG: AAA family ATPase [Victivallaceae bacterium]
MAVSDSDELMEFLRNHFVPIDNIPEDIKLRDELCMEARASLLIESNCTSERFPGFMKCGRRDQGWIFKFKTPYEQDIHHNDYSHEHYLWFFEEFGINTGKSETDDNGEAIARWQLSACKDLSTKDKIRLRHHVHHPTDQGFYIGYNLTDDQFNICYLNDYKEMQNRFRQDSRSKFRLCRDLSPYKTPQQVCRFWGTQTTPFAEIKQGHLRPDSFNIACSKSAKTAFSDQQDSSQELSMANDFVPCGIVGESLTQFLNHYCEWAENETLPFKNEYGEVTMQLIKLYDFETQSKILLPVTTWMRSGSPYNQLFCVPLPDKKQPLYNLDLLMSDNCECVILTDSVEIAEKNQRNAPFGIVFTSFICEPTQYEQIDWSPLYDKTVYFLITNHSGISSEIATLKAEELRDFLTENESTIDLQYIFLETEYPDASRVHFKTKSDALSYYVDHRPEVNSGSLRIIGNGEEFEALLKSADEFIKKKSLKWWSEQPIQEQARIAEREYTKKDPIPYVMRPLLIRGEATMLYAPKGIGKSSLAYSIAACVVAKNFSTKAPILLPEKWWTVTKEKHKVLYLDFENQSRIDICQQNYQAPYFPKGKEADCRNNLIVKDMSIEAKDFSREENHAEILQMLEDASQQGTPGVPVDLLVIDTYTGFVHVENPSTPTSFKDLLNKIRKMDIAILIVHHANAEGVARGQQSKLDSLAFKFKLYRDGDEHANLDEPIMVEYEENRYGMDKKLREPFQIRWFATDKKWHVFEPKRNEKEELTIIYDEYKKSGYDRDAICSMLGMGKSALNQKINQEEEK